MQVNLASTVNATLNWLDVWSGKHVPFVVAAALTDTAVRIGRTETDVMSRVFDQPTPFTLRAVGVTPATKVELRAVVFLKTTQARYLFSEITGGKREVKQFEKKFGAIGSAAVTVPGQGVRLNQYGNLSKRQLLSIARDLNSSGSAKRFFKGVPKYTQHATKPMPPGIYARVNNNTRIVPLIIFATAAHYRKRFEFSAIAQRTVDAVFEQRLLARWEQALRTA